MVPTRANPAPSSLYRSQWQRHPWPLKLARAHLTMTVPSAMLCAASSIQNSPLSHTGSDSEGTRPDETAVHAAFAC